MKIQVTIPTDATQDVEYTLDGETVLRASGGDVLTIEPDEDGDFYFRIRAVDKIVAAPSFEQPRPDSIATEPALNSATAPGAQATVEAAGADTPAGEPLGEALTEGGNDDLGGDDTIGGGEGTETGADTNYGLGGSDSLGGEGGEDTITGGQSDQSTGGAEGQDTITGGGDDDTHTGGEPSGDQTGPREATDDEIRQALADLETQPSVEKTASGKVEVNTINEFLAARGLKPIKAARRDALAAG